METAGATDTEAEASARRARSTFMRLPRLKVWWSVAKRVFAQLDELNLMLISAGIAFYGLVAIFPAFAALIALWGLFADPTSVLPQLEYYRLVIPSDAFDLLAGQVNTLASADTGTLGWASAFSLGVALWSTRAGVAALMLGMNAVYRERNRQGLSHIAYALLLTLSLLVVALIAIAAIIVTPIVMAFVPLGPAAELALELVRLALAVVVLLLGAGIIYRYGPNRKNARVGWITPGAVMAVALWGLASWAFGVYLAEFGRYNEIYGSIGAVVALLMWLFISAFLLLLGGAVNAELERHTLPDSTVGPPKPLGEREAQAADTFIEV